ncbi:aminotransferase class I/II-fold pyridoxal phosphate-dependent enzyme [Romboutsia sp.]|uniref:aminotransferase class I/II-fold pyridoxal phosphate-dependent enzyme n=1 Tax=Romboutsia sp. TaxID=1965302 RepID=UPI003F3CAFA8
MNFIDKKEASLISKSKCYSQEEVYLLDGLKKYSLKEIACFDVPGHVKEQGVDILNKYFGEQVMKMDINSSPLMDNIATPNGIIKKSQELLANAYNADDAFFITNGTTGAIHAMILSTINPGDKVILPRNIHKSVINALILSGGEPIFVQPEFNGDLGISLNISIESIKSKLEEVNDAKAVFILNPTYYGACTDLKKIVELCHEKGVLVLVDEAHGAHFPFNKDLPPSSMVVGADMSAISIHKTGGALTQSSAILVNKTNIDTNKVLQSINMLQSTSASYLLMASIDGARYNLIKNGEEQLSKALDLARYARLKLNQISGINVFCDKTLINDGVTFIDNTKLCINVKDLNITGHQVYDLLYQEYGVQAELGDLYNVLALISIGTTKQDIDKLINAIIKISKNYRNKDNFKQIEIKQIIPNRVITPREAFYSQKESIKIDNCINRICAESIMAYPPGIPIISPGEVISLEIIEYLKLLKENNAHLTDMKDKTLKTIFVIKEK